MSVISLGSLKGSSYIDDAYRHDVALGSRVVHLPTRDAIAQHFPSNVEIGCHDSAGYLNRDGGWANASLGISTLVEKVRGLGAEILPGREMVEIVFSPDGEKALGVRLKSGEVMTADVTVIATGAWTGSLVPDVDLGIAERLLATGQSVATIKLDQEEARKYADCPVILDFQTGFYIFPPNGDNIIKMAIHHAGYVNPYSSSGSIMGVSTPRTIISHPEDGNAIPKVMVSAIRARLAAIYPALADRKFEDTRLCWYADTADANWLIDFHPMCPSSLLFATGGSGHAYKFLPVIGRLVADRLRGVLDPAVAARFSFGRRMDEGDASRRGQMSRILREQDLVLAGSI